MKVALVHCPIRHKKFSENLRVVDEEFCLAPPISLAYVASIIEKAGHKVKLIDAHALKLSKQETASSIRQFGADIIGFRLDSYQFFDTLDWIKSLKKNTGLMVLAGGINISLYPKESLLHQEIDYGVIGEAPETLPELLNALKNGSSVLNISGIVYRLNGSIVINPPKEKALDFDSYPFPARHLLPNEKYYSFISQKKNFTIMVTSKGCPYKCTFCAISKLPYLERSAVNVVKEIEQCYYDYGIREIDFFDGVFTFNRPRTIEICRQIKRRLIDIEWSCRSRVDLVDEELLKEMSDAGCRQIYYGIETGNAQILAAINKRVNYEQIEKAIRLSKKHGIRTMGFFMIGLPAETKASVRQTIKLMKQLDLDFVQVCRAIAKPNTGLHGMLKKQSGRDYWLEYISGKELEERIPSPWTGLSQKELENYVKLAYYSFYFRPRYILKIIFSIKSISELFRFVRVGLRMVLFLFSSDVRSYDKKKREGN